MKIFLVEDDKELNKIVTKTLELTGYKVFSFTDGIKAFENISADFDIFLIDIGLPNMGGLELIKQIKLIDSNNKIFVISGCIDIDTIIKAYDLGCDDYIKKPFDVREVLLKINRELLQSSQIIHLSKECIYNPVKKLLFHKDKMVMLTKKETLLLYILINNIGKTVYTEHIEDYVWGETVGNGYVRQLISKLRKSVPCDIIRNHVSKGYRIEKYDKS